MKIGNWKKWFAGACMMAVFGGTSVFPALAADAGWSRLSENTASWEKVDSADGYQLRLYRDDTYLRTIKVTKNKVDLSEYLTKEGTYYYEVCAYFETDGRKNDVTYGSYTLSEDRIVDDLGDTDGRWRHFVDGKKYQKEDETYAEHGWYRISGNWYYFDENAFAATGWRLIDQNWYYMDADGVMQTGWIQVDDAWYFLNQDGAMATGWVQMKPGEWYYFYSDGTMAANAVIDGYAVNESGIWSAYEG